MLPSLVNQAIRYITSDPQGITGAGICETQDFLNNSAGAIVAAIAGWAVTALRRQPAQV